jgi:predicted metal-dependent hydrolase
MSFPVGEQFFIDAVRDGHKALTPEQQARFAPEVQGFIGQEAAHRRLHGLYNEHLERQGLVNHWGPRALRRRQLLDGLDVRHALAATAAYEHFTAILADWMLRHPQALGHEDPRLVTMWLWHASEESEHKCTAFDLYRALGGNEGWRLKWFRRITFYFVTDALRQTVSNLRRDGTFWRLSTWGNAITFLFGAGGLVRDTLPTWRAYKRHDFHPNQQDSQPAAQWLARHGDQYQALTSPAA